MRDQSLSYLLESYLVLLLFFRFWKEFCLKIFAGLYGVAQLPAEEVVQAQSVSHLSPNKVKSL